MATESSFVQPAVPKFDGHYDHWAMLMENFLRSKEYWIVVENEIPAAAEGGASSEAERKRIEGLKLTDLKAKNYLFQALDRSILETILKKDTAKNIWDSMKQKFQSATRVKNSHLQALRKEFEILEMKIGESVNEYFARTLSIVNKMNANGETKSDADVVSKILRSMTSKFNYVVCSIEESKDTSKLTIDELQSSLLVHEQRMNMNSLAEEAQAFKISFSDQSNARGRGRGNYRGRGRGRARQSFDKAIIECYKCHKLGHFQWECSSKEANYVETEEEMLLMAFMDANDGNKEDTWFLDSGCSNHMCGKKEYFTDFDESFVDKVKLGNNTSLAVTGKGNVRFLVDGMVQRITGVFYVPELKNNLLSIGQLQEKGLAILFQHDRCKVYHSEKGLIMDMKMAPNRMFKLHVVTAPSTCFSTITEAKAQLWHCRYGHLSYNGLKTLQQKDMVNGLPELGSSLAICKDCMKCENAGVCDLEWGDQEIDVPEPGEGDSVNESEVVTDIEKCTSDVSTGADLPGTNVRRHRVQPTWMRDYETGEGLSEDENEACLVMSTADDPVTSAIKLSKNPVMHGRSKHIDVRFHFLRELTKSGKVELVHCDSQDQVADVMTKPLKVDQFCKLRKSMGVCAEAGIN
nr:Retrovirus-related Pol polyprotein from transposon TNT 1-94 [Ipomoea batatas]